MIPKIIHYCWLSNDPVPEHLEKCMASWKDVLKDYEFIKWDFNRFDKESSLWVCQAFDNKKYAFAADYIRLYALYNYGGIYLDMDVEVLRPFDDLLDSEELICYERNSDFFEMATIGASKGAEWVKNILDYYDNRSFILPDGNLDTFPLPNIAMHSLKNRYTFVDRANKNKSNLYNSLIVYSSDYFSPKSYKTGKLYLTDNTYSIHHFEGSWLSEENKYKLKINKKLNFLPYNLSRKISASIAAIKYRGFVYFIKLAYKHFICYK